MPSLELPVKKPKNKWYRNADWSAKLMVTSKNRIPLSSNGGGGNLCAHRNDTAIQNECVQTKPNQFLGASLLTALHLNALNLHLTALNSYLAVVY